MLQDSTYSIDTDMSIYCLKLKHYPHSDYFFKILQIYISNLIFVCIRAVKGSIRKDVRDMLESMLAVGK